MRRCLLFVIALGLFSLSLTTTAEQGDKEPVRKAFGLDKRAPWTTSKVIGSPEPPPPYKTELAFPKLPKFEEPLDLTYAPGTDRLFVAGRWGKIWSFVNKKDVDKADLALEFKPKKVIYAITFHPKFKENGYLFVTWIPNPEKEAQPNGTRVSRFTVKGEPPVVNLASEKIIFEWRSGGHNGGCIKFGPDGFLYIVTGDGSGIADSDNIGQDLSSIHAKLLRIDVDNVGEPRGVSPRLNYSIPKDNPFITTKAARPEVFAYGLRQLWRFSFDRKTGDLWGGEVGQDLWESIYKIEKGGNYGWSVKEGTHDFRPERKVGPTPILKPVVGHSHTDFRSITGGFVYRGKRLPDLKGHYIYGDFDTGRVWAFNAEGGPIAKVLADYREKQYARLKELLKEGVEDRSGDQEYLLTQVNTAKQNAKKQLNDRELARTTYRIVTWGEDAEGEIYFCDFTGGGIYQLVKAPSAKPQANFPRKLSETGLFASTKDHKIAVGVIPYSVNAQLWGDHTAKERFLAIPGNGQIGFDEITYPQPSPGAPPGWKFPDGTVLVKTFSMDMERGNPKSRKRLETRILHFQQFPGTQEYGDQYWRGYTYVWNDEQTDAGLLDEKGLDKKLTIKVGDKTIEQNYRFPSRAECTLCHTNAAKFALGVSTMQMNRDQVYPSPGGNGVGTIANQLATLEHLGMFAKLSKDKKTLVTAKLPKAPKDLPKIADFNDKSIPVDVRARSYLHSNCAHCHMKWGGGNAEFKLLATIPLEEMGIVNVNPAHGNFKIDGAKLLVPGSPEKSILLHRMNMTGLGRMPHIGSRVIDEQAVQLVREWIKGMK